MQKHVLIILGIKNPREKAIFCFTLKGRQNNLHRRKCVKALKQKNKITKEKCREFQCFIETNEEKQCKIIKSKLSKVNCSTLDKKKINNNL